ncbi:hypothetical protein LEM8419_03491 [Neolewinella maritima]|uniref:Methyltransferase n=1 Tax=Neolewinella maritima TaxID=1383882 RepID=A0ABM9B5F0_9BACT|nr:DNA methyltransferase [Neolewinella maritima]CAH1002619.1 hypothetical protein LEM8419_03491 [Neolewinella maritima]
MSNLFLNADCMDPEVGLPSLPSDSVDIMPVDPPYGIDFQSAWRTESQRFKKIANDKTPFTVWLKEAYRVLKPGGRLFIFYRWDVAKAFQDAAQEAGFTVVYEMVWDKGNHGLGDLKACPAPKHEMFLYCTKGRYEFEGKRPTSIIKAMRVSGPEMIHPNEKPELLYKALYRSFSAGVPVVVDPFAGSAASLRAAESMGFNYVGYELDPDYYAAAQARMAKGIQMQLL